MKCPKCGAGMLPMFSTDGPTSSVCIACELSTLRRADSYRFTGMGARLETENTRYYTVALLDDPPNLSPTHFSQWGALAPWALNLGRAVWESAGWKALDCVQRVAK